MFLFNANVPLPVKGAHNIIMLTATATTMPTSLDMDRTQIALVKTADGWMIFKVDSTNSASPPELLLTSSRHVKSVTYSVSGAARLVTIVVAAPSGVAAFVFVLSES